MRDFAACADLTDALADGEARRTALDHLGSAWAEGRLEGLDGDCLAQAALFLALAELVETYGEEPAAVFAERLADRIRGGEFTLPTARQ